jgi:hypothetical protein
LPQIAVPVLGVQRRGVHSRAGDRGVEGDLGGARRETRERVEQVLAELGHLCRVPGELDAGDRPRQHSVVGQPGTELLQCLGVARDGHRGRPVDGGDRDPLTPWSQPGARLLRGQRDEEHPAPAHQGAQGPAAQRHHLGRLLQRQGARDAGRGDLALAVAHHGRRLHAVGPPQLRQRHHHREQHRLDHVHPVQRRSAGSLAQHLQQGPVDIRCQGAIAGGDPLREDRSGLQQFRCHTDPLGALTGEDEDGRAGGAGHTPDQGPARPPVGQRVQIPQEAVAILAGDDGAVREGGPGGGERVADVDRLGFGVVREVCEQPLRLALQRVRCPGGQRPQDRGRIHRGAQDRGRIHRGALGSLLGGLLHDDVRVGATHSEGGHTCPSGVAVPLPLLGLGQQRDRARRPVDFRGRLIRVQRARQHAVPHGLHHLDDTRHA